MPLGVAQLLFLVLGSVVATLVPNVRLTVMIFNTLTSMVGMIMVYTLHGRAGRMAGLCLGGVFATNIPLTLSLVSSNVGGFTKRSIVGATIFIGYCVGNIAGPQFFLASEEPRYPVCTTPHSHLLLFTLSLLSYRPASKLLSQD
jgi:MFS family permease